MGNIAILRKIVNNGWTIAKRRNIISQIGKNNFDEIVLNAKKLNITGDIYEFKYTKGHFAPESLSETKSWLSKKIKLLKSRWENPIVDYRVPVAQNSQVPMHHYTNGINGDIRYAFKGLESKNPSEFQLMSVKTSLPYIQATDEAFSKLPLLEKDCIVYRGRTKQAAKSFNTDFDIISKAKIGDTVIPDTGYSYCALDKSLANSWLSSSQDSILYTIRLPKGSQVSRNLEHGGEVLMPRGAEYKVISKEVQGNQTNVTLEYILPKKDNLKEANELMAKYNLKKYTAKQISEIVE